MKRIVSASVLCLTLLSATSCDQKAAPEADPNVIKAGAEHKAEQQKQEEQAKQLLRQIIAERFPSLTQYVADTKEGILDLGGASFGLKATLSRANSFTNSEIGQLLRMHEGNLQAGCDLLHHPAPECVKEEVISEVEGLRTSALSLQNLIESFYNFSGEMDGRVLAQRMISAQSEMETAKRQVDSFGYGDVLDIIKPDSIEALKSEAARREYLIDHPDIARKLEQEKQDELARQAALAKEVEEKAARQAELDKQEEVAQAEKRQQAEKEQQAEAERQAEEARQRAAEPPEEVRQARKAEYWRRIGLDETLRENTLSDLRHAHQSGSNDRFRCVRALTLHLKDGDVMLRAGTQYRFVRWEDAGKVIVTPCESLEDRLDSNPAYRQYSIPSDGMHYQGVKPALPGGLVVPVEWLTSIAVEEPSGL